MSSVYLKWIEDKPQLFHMATNCKHKAGVTVHEVCLLDAVCWNNDELWAQTKADGPFDFVCDYKGPEALADWPQNIAEPDDIGAPCTKSGSHPPEDSGKCCNTGIDADSGKPINRIVEGTQKMSYRECR